MRVHDVDAAIADERFQLRPDRGVEGVAIDDLGVVDAEDSAARRSEQARSRASRI
jgi:hypothetical protein